MAKKRYNAKNAGKIISDKIKSGNNTYLGAVTWFYIRDLRVNVSNLEAFVSKNKLDSKLIPSTSHAHDAFRRATSEAQIKSQRKENNYLVRSLPETAIEIRRKIVQERKDTTNKDLKYKIVGEMVFNKSNQSVSFENKMKDKEVDAIIKDAEKRYKDYSTYLVGSNFRSCIHRYLESIDMIPLSQLGRVYFVPLYNRELLDGVKILVEWADQFAVANEKMTHSEFDYIAVEETPQQKDTIQGAVAQSIKNGLVQLMNDWKGLLQKDRKNKASENMVENRISSLLELKNKVKRFKELVATDVTEIDEAISLVQEQAATYLQENSVDSRLDDLAKVLGKQKYPKTKVGYKVKVRKSCVALKDKNNKNLIVIFPTRFGFSLRYPKTEADRAVQKFVNYPITEFTFDKVVDEIKIQMNSTLKWANK